MGEWSKKIGEAGENIAGEFLRLIGWGSAQKGIEMPCAHPDLHKGTGGPRRTHGLDYLFSYRSPLVDGVGQNVIISVKFSTQGYTQSNPGGIFKNHFSELAQMVECFKKSSIRRSASETVKGVAKTQDIGVLLWINNDRESDGDVISKVQRLMVPDTFHFEVIYLVDNNRASFVFNTINYAQRIGGGCEVEFFYPDTGKNINPLCNVKHGRILPVEYINSSLLALRLVKEKSEMRTLLLSTLERFSEPGLKRLLGLAHNLSQGWCSTVVITFPDFDSLRHSNAVQLAKSSFSNASFVLSVKVDRYDADFRN
jgi:hypothetical protein